MGIFCVLSLDTQGMGFMRSDLSDSSILAFGRVLYTLGQTPGDILLAHAVDLQAAREPFQEV